MGYRRFLTYLLSPPDPPSRRELDEKGAVMGIFNVCLEEVDSMLPSRERQEYCKIPPARVRAYSLWLFQRSLMDPLTARPKEDSKEVVRREPRGYFRIRGPLRIYNRPSTLNPPLNPGF